MVQKKNLQKRIVKKSASTAESTQTLKRKNQEKKSVGVSGCSTLRGMKDMFGAEAGLFQDIYVTGKKIATSYGFGYVETPVLEQAQLFIRSIGKGTEVVDKEMYVFEDKDGTKVCLRPEMTASIARAYISNGMHSMPQPVKLWYLGSMFRHDRPQAGRYRQFHQFGCETIGDHNPVIEAELIVVAYNMLRDLGITSVVKINSIGTREDRENYVVELAGYLKSKRSYLSEDSKKRINKNPLRVLDSKLEQDIAVVEEAPQIIDWLSEDSKKFFMCVLEYLDEAGVPYVLAPTLVRGLEYYTDTVFELFADTEEEGSQSALVGGGRYNGLIEQLGGQSVPAAGFSMGIERVMNLIKKSAPLDRQEHTQKKGGIFFAQLGEQARKRSLLLLEELRRSGLEVRHNLAKSSLKAQLELANKFGSTHTLIVGQKEVQDGTIIIRNMESGIQEVVDQKKITQAVQRLLDVEGKR